MPSRISTARYRPCTYPEDQGAVFSSYSSTTSTRIVTGGVTSVPALRIRRAIVASISSCMVIGKLVYGLWQTRVWSLANSCMVIGTLVYGHWQTRVWSLANSCMVIWQTRVWFGKLGMGFQRVTDDDGMPLLPAGVIVAHADCTGGVRLMICSCDARLHPAHSSVWCHKVGPILWLPAKSLHSHCGGEARWRWAQEEWRSSRAAAWAAEGPMGVLWWRRETGSCEEGGGESWRSGSQQGQTACSHGCLSW
jgi:hypothetical protein